MTKSTTPRRAAPADGPVPECESRCDCGSLLARWTSGGLEIKCRRCKRRVVVRVEGRAPPDSR